MNPMRQVLEGGGLEISDNTYTLTVKALPRTRPWPTTAEVVMRQGRIVDRATADETEAEGMEDPV